MSSCSARCWIVPARSAAVAVATDLASAAGGIFRTRSLARRCKPPCASSLSGNLLVRRQLDKRDDPQSSDWIWVTTLSPTEVPVEQVVRLVHQP